VEGDIRKPEVVGQMADNAAINLLDSVEDKSGLFRSLHSRSAAIGVRVPNDC
jgi:hypothetical protein